MLSTRVIPRMQLPRLALCSQSTHVSAAIRRFATQAPAPKFIESTFVKERDAVKQHATGSSELWRKLSIYVVIPSIILAGINAYNLWNEHWEHWEHQPPLPERTYYPYQNIRTRNYFWGDGDKTLFWNPKVNYHKRDE